MARFVAGLGALGSMYSVVFYKTEAGNEPALDWFRALEPEERRIVGYELRLLQVGFPMGLPRCRALGDDLFELRCTLPNKIARVLFFLDGHSFIVVHGFIKKSQKTPSAELETARARQRKYKF
ncbi:MAG: type II toxin-antitoxin system RelE/ParE family toxin [Devosia sp.]